MMIVPLIAAIARRILQQQELATATTTIICNQWPIDAAATATAAAAPRAAGAIVF